MALALSLTNSPSANQMPSVDSRHAALPFERYSEGHGSTQLPQKHGIPQQQHYSVAHLDGEVVRNGIQNELHLLLSGLHIKARHTSRQTSMSIYGNHVCFGAPRAKQCCNRVRHPTADSQHTSSNHRAASSSTASRPVGTQPGPGVPRSGLAHLRPHGNVRGRVCCASDGLLQPRQHEHNPSIFGLWNDHSDCWAVSKFQCVRLCGKQGSVQACWTGNVVIPRGQRDTARRALIHPVAATKTARCAAAQSAAVHCWAGTYVSCTHQPLGNNSRAV